MRFIPPIFGWSSPFPKYLVQVWHQIFVQGYSLQSPVFLTCPSSLIMWPLCQADDIPGTKSTNHTSIERNVDRLAWPGLAPVQWTLNSLMSMRVHEHGSKNFFSSNNCAHAEDLLRCFRNARPVIATGTSCAYSLFQVVRFLIKKSPNDFKFYSWLLRRQDRVFGWGTSWYTLELGKLTDFLNHLWSLTMRSLVMRRQWVSNDVPNAQASIACDLPVYPIRPIDLIVCVLL